MKKKKKPETEDSYNGSDCQDEVQDVSVGNQPKKTGLFRRKKKEQEPDEVTGTI